MSIQIDAAQNQGPSDNRVKRALLSVFDKSGLVEFAKRLSEAGVELVASGGTARVIEEAGVSVIKVEDFTGAPEVLGGRVKTLNPKIHSGLLFDRRVKSQAEDMQREGYAEIDLVVCNLYPFTQVVEGGGDRAECIENIDIGGPAMIRASAKNADGGVAVVVSPSDYDAVASAIESSGKLEPEMRRGLANKAFAATAAYDRAIADYLSGAPAPFSDYHFERELRYGENPHQKGYVYRFAGEEGGVAWAEVSGGKPPSYNNYLDLDAAVESVRGFSRPSCAIIKHTNPCGLASAETLGQAFADALAGDPVSAFGSVIAFNRTVDAACATTIAEAKLFIECLAAPAFDDEAKEILRKKKDLRWVTVDLESGGGQQHFHRIGGGFLLQERDNQPLSTADWKCVTKAPVDDATMHSLLFAMNCVRALKSNAIVVAKDERLLGAGAGLMSRVDACELAIKKAGDEAQGGVLASDAFFPFPDALQLAIDAGVRAVVQPGGAKRDEAVIEAADAAGIAMVFTGKRHFRH